MNIFQWFWKFFCEVFGVGQEALPLAQYTVWHSAVGLVGCLLMAGIILGIIFLAGYIVISVLKGIFRLLRNIFSAKDKCQKIQCRSCGRTLDKCTCEKNNGRGYIRRLALYSKETKDLKRKQKGKK